MEKICSSCNKKFKIKPAHYNKRFSCSKECQHCKKLGGVLHSHHIKSFSKYKDLRFNVNNGLTLCFNCHKKLHNNMNFIITKEL